MNNVARELNILRHWCSLHRHDIPGSWGLGQSGTENTRTGDMVIVRVFVSKMSRMVTHFHGSSQAQDHLRDSAQEQAILWLQFVHRVTAMQLEDQAHDPENHEANMALSQESISGMYSGHESVIDVSTGQPVALTVRLISGEDGNQDEEGSRGHGFMGECVDGDEVQHNLEEEVLQSDAQEARLDSHLLKTGQSVLALPSVCGGWPKGPFECGWGSPTDSRPRTIFGGGSKVY
jgi:hypothetical protein